MIVRAFKGGGLTWTSLGAEKLSLGMFLRGEFGVEVRIFWELWLMLVKRGQMLLAVSSLWDPLIVMVWLISTLLNNSHMKYIKLIQTVERHRI